jgi:hypothetical protein
MAKMNRCAFNSGAFSLLSQGEPYVCITVRLVPLSIMRIKGSFHSIEERVDIAHRDVHVAFEDQLSITTAGRWRRKYSSALFVETTIDLTDVTTTGWTLSRIT